MKNIVKIISINFIILIIGLIFLELFFGSWLKSSSIGSLLIPKQQNNIIDKFPYLSTEIGIYTRDKNGFRANQYNLDEIDILVLGGSTTEERDVDDKKIWTKVFEKNLSYKLKVLNAGIGGQTSFGHKSMFKLWFNKLDLLSPKFIVIFLGINDSLFYVENMDNHNFPNNGRELNSSNRDTLLYVNFKDNLIQYIKNNSVLHSLYLIIKGNIITNNYNLRYNSQPKIIKLQETNPPKYLLQQKDYDNNFKNYYYENLSEILNYSKKYNSELILITQSISTEHWLYDYLIKINNFTLNFCLNNKTTCIDLASEIKSLNKNDFYDGIHTTPSGSKKIGKFISKKFEKLIK